MQNNSLMILRPYFYHGMWVFDDPLTGLVREPFVEGVPEILEKVLDRKGILEQARAGFNMVFSAEPFPGHDIKADWLKEEFGGNWYEFEGESGWLCPALFKYFDVAPKEIYAKLSL